MFSALSAFVYLVIIMCWVQCQSVSSTLCFPVCMSVAPVSPASPDASQVCASMGKMAMTLERYLDLIALPDPTWIVSGMPR